MDSHLHEHLTTLPKPILNSENLECIDAGEEDVEDVREAIIFDKPGASLFDVEGSQERTIIEKTKGMFRSAFTRASSSSVCAARCFLCLHSFHTRPCGERGWGGFSCLLDTVHSEVTQLTQTLKSFFLKTPFFPLKLNLKKK